MDCKWLPELFPCENWAEYQKYEAQLYEIFKHDFIDTYPFFEDKKVTIRKEPRIDGHEQAFYHITNKEFEANKDRVPDSKRCERIKWVRAFIENYKCDPSLCEDCDGLKVWEEEYKNNYRVHLLFEEENYVVILERREKYVLLITAYYFDYPHALRKELKKYNAYINNNS